MNPILNALNGQNRLAEALKVANMLKTQNADEVLSHLTQGNAQFRDFVAKYKNTKPDEILRDFGVNPDVLRQFK